MPQGNQLRMNYFCVGSVIGENVYVAFNSLLFLDGDQDILTILNNVFRPTLPDKDDERSYKRESLALKEICARVLKHTSPFDKADDPLKALLYWFRTNRPAFMEVPVKRPRVATSETNVEQVRVLPLYVLDEKHWGELLYKI